MLSGSKNRFFGTVKLRLTLLAGTIIVCSALAAYVVMYASIAAALQTNVDHYLQSELDEFRGIYSRDGLEGLRAEFRLEEFAQGNSHIFMRAFDTGGNALFSSDLAKWGAAAGAPATLPRPGTPALSTIAVTPGHAPGRRIEGYVGEGIYVVLGVSTANHAVVLNAYRDRFLQIFVVVTCVSLLGAWLIARRAMKGVERVTAAAEEIAGGALDRRIAGQGYGYEIDRLASVFNKMIEKIASLVNEARTLNDNIAHELRSPLTRIRGAAEVSATGENTSGDCRELASIVVEECDGLLNIVNSMLSISQMESGLARVGASPVDCARLIHDTCDFFQPIAEDKRIALEADIRSDITISGDSPRLQQAVANLIDNALKYTDSGGRIDVSLDRKNGTAVISVCDTGPGIGEKDLPHIFERFYRGESARAAPGNGLGLGLVHAIVTAHGGTVDVSSVIGRGTTFSVHLPA